MSTDPGPFGPLLDTRLRVMTWNIWWRFGPWEQRQPAIAATIARVGPDVVALQEVWADGERNQAAELADGLGYSWVYDTRLDLDGVRFGNAVLSRWPIASSDSRPLPAPPDQDELRKVVRADIEGPRGTVQVFCTHLNWRFDQSATRQEQVRAVAQFVHESPTRTFPALVCGDFNAVPDAEEIRMLTGRAAVPVPRVVFHDAWDVAGPSGDPGITWSNDNPYARLDLEPERRIDYVFVGWPKAGGAGHVVDVRVDGAEPVDGVVGSDHYAVVAELLY